MCKKPGFEWLCLIHYEEILDRAFGILERDDLVLNERRTRFYAHWFAATEEGWDGSPAEAEALLADYDVARARRDTTVYSVQWLRRHGDVASVVYYVRLGDRIKIGTSVNLPQRMQALSLPLDAVVATEPGSLRREREVHERFDWCRDVGEWFRAEPELLSHVAELRERAGLPPL